MQRRVRRRECVRRIKGEKNEKVLHHVTNLAILLLKETFKKSSSDCLSH